MDSMHSIDAFFRVLAEDCGPRGAAVVLSGAGPDGSQGVVMSTEAGGLVVLQEAANASFDAAPAAAIDQAPARRDPAGSSPIIARKQSARARPSDVIATSKRDPSSEHATSEQGFDHSSSSNSGCGACRRHWTTRRPSGARRRDLESLLASLSDAVYFKDASGKFLRTLEPGHGRPPGPGPTSARVPSASARGDMPNVDGREPALHRDDELVLTSGQAQHFRLERWESPDEPSTGRSSPGFRCETARAPSSG